MKAGDRIGADFRLLRQLGDHVWKAERLSTSEPVAIRFAPEGIRDDPTARTGFAERAQRAQAIDSDRAVEIVGFGVTPEGRPYLVMEWLEGETLADRLSRERQLGRSTLVAILRQLAGALEAAHGRGVVHGALEPRRVFLVAGAAAGVKVLDLGAPRPDAQDGGYASPASRRDDYEAGAADDHWALAAIAFRALTGQRPFAGLEAAAAGRFVAPSKLSPAFSPAIDRWFSRAFALDPRARFGTSAEMVAAFEEALRAKPPPPSRLLPFLDGLALLTSGVAAVLVGAAIALIDGF